MNNSPEFVNSPSSSHQSLYKNNGLSTSSLHQKHRDETVELRKKKRDDGFTRTRRLLELTQEPSEPMVKSVLDQYLINDLTSRDEGRELKALRIYSKLFSSPDSIDQIQDMNVISVFADIFLRSDPLTELESQSIISLSKLSNDFGLISSFFSSGVIAKLVNSLDSENFESLDHTLFLLEEVVRLDPGSHKICADLNLLPTSLRLYLRFDRVDLRRQIVTMMNNYFDNNIPVEDITMELLDFFKFVLTNEADEILLRETFEIITKIAQVSRAHADLLISNGFLLISQFLDGSIAHDCILFIQVVVKHGENYMKALTDLGYFEKIWAIAHSKLTPAKYRGDAFSTIAMFFKYGFLRYRPELTNDLITPLIESLCESGFEVRRQSLLTIKQILYCCGASVMEKCINDKLLGTLCDLLTVMHVDTVLNSIRCLDKIMDFAVSKGIEVDVRDILEAHNAQEKFEFLTNGQSYEVFKVADTFITKYFEDPSEDQSDLRCTA